MIVTTKFKYSLIGYKDVFGGSYLYTIQETFLRKWEDNKELNYKQMLDYFEQEFGYMAKFAVLISKYNYQVKNGGHYQYFNNGYCDGIGGVYDQHDPSIPLHKELIEYFKQSGLKDSISQNVLQILQDLIVVLDESGDIANTDYLSKLDDRYYKLNEEFMEIVENHFKELIEIKNKIYVAHYNSYNQKHEIAVYFEAPRIRVARYIASKHKIDRYTLRKNSIRLLKKSMTDLDYSEQLHFKQGIAEFEHEIIDS